MSRSEATQREIDEGNVKNLQYLAGIEPGNPRMCGCLGPVDGEPLCRCAMDAKQIGDALDIAALEMGWVVYVAK